MFLWSGRGRWGTGKGARGREIDGGGVASALRGFGVLKESIVRRADSERAIKAVNV